MVLRALGRLRSLCQHRWGYEAPLAPDLKTLIPDAANYRGAVDREISRLIPTVAPALDTAKIPTKIRELNRPSSTIHRASPREFHLIQDILQLPRGPTDVVDSEMFHSVLGAIDQGIGFHEDRRREALLRAINPVQWAAWVLRFPLEILERAGVELSGPVYEWTLKLVMLVIVTSVAARLGLEVPWEDVLGMLGRGR